MEPPSHHPIVLPSSGSTPSLFVRHFPSWLSREEKESLLRHFGARDVVVMGTKGKMRNCAIVNFAQEGEAKWAMSKLHQLDVFGQKLSVEYARPAHTRQLQDADTDSWPCNKTRPSDQEGVEDTMVEQTREFRPRLKPESPRYLYPPPTPTTLTNITNALACVPQLYVQVLHLMNRLNLPPPFGDLTPTPPLLSQQPSGVEEPADYERASEEEGSEISSDEERAVKRERPTHVPRHAPKRRAMSYQQVKSLLPSMKKRRTQKEEEEPAVTTKKIELNIPSEILPRPELEAHTVTYITASEKPLNRDFSGPKSASDSTYTKQGDDSQEEPTPQTASCLETEPGSEASMGRSGDIGRSSEQFISTEELKTKRLSEKEMQEYSVYNKYSPGEPSMRLYIKNLGKHVEEKNLRYVYGRYVNWSSENESNAFDIRLMQTGRMKGQAFVGLPSEEAAARALTETNGYMLHDRPMVVQFGRSTKAKETSVP